MNINNKYLNYIYLNISLKLKLKEQLNYKDIKKKIHIIFYNYFQNLYAFYKIKIYKNKIK